MSPSVKPVALPKTFDAVWAKADAIPGWLDEQEARCLWRHARSPWCEVGSWQGRSAYVIASKAGAGWSVDNYRGAPSHHLEAQAVAGGLDVRAAAKKNLRGLPVTFAERTVGPWPLHNPGEIGALRFLYLDADHAAGKTREAFNQFAPLVRPGGLVAFHDYGDPGWPDVRDFCDGLPWVRVDRQERVLVLRKPKAAT